MSPNSKKNASHRNLPIPTTISPQAQAILAQASPFGGRPEPDPLDIEAWEKLVSENNKMMTAMLAERSIKFAPQQLTEHSLSHSTLYEIEPKGCKNGIGDGVILFIHGGGFTIGGGLSAAYSAYQIAALTGLRAFSIDYRMPPKSPFPAGLDDSVEAYRFILDRYAPEQLALYGGSAGGGLAASCLLKARDFGLPMPAACVLHSPEADLTESGDSFESNDGADGALRRLTNSIKLYANGNDLRDPYLSPLFGDFRKGFPPTLLTSGTRDLFLSNTVLMHRTLLRAGVTAELHIWEAMGHAGFHGAAPEDQELLGEHVRFIREYV